MTMALSNDDKEWIKLISEKLCYEVTENVIKKHIQSCPHGRSILAGRWFVTGICIGSGLIGGGIGAACMKIIFMI